MTHVWTCTAVAFSLTTLLQEKQEEEMEEMMQHLRWEVRILRIPEMLGKMRRRLQEEARRAFLGLTMHKWLEKQLRQYYTKKHQKAVFRFFSDYSTSQFQYWRRKSSLARSFRMLRVWVQRQTCALGFVQFVGLYAFFFKIVFNDIARLVGKNAKCKLYFLNIASSFPSITP